MVRYIFAVIHSSSCSARMAVTRRRQLAVLGNNVATRVLHLISLLSRSSALVVRMRTRFSAGNTNTVKPSARFVSAQAASLGCALRQPSIAKPSSRVASFASGALKMERIVRDTGTR